MPHFGQVQSVANVPGAGRPIHHHGHFAGEERGEVRQVSRDRSGEHDADPRTRQPFDQRLQHQDRRDQVAIRPHAAELVGHDRPAGAGSGLAQEDFGDRLPRRKRETLVGAAARPSGRDRLQLHGPRDDRLSAGRQHDFADGLEGIHVGLGEAELLREPEDQLGLGEAVQTEVLCEAVLVAQRRGAA